MTFNNYRFAPSPTGVMHIGGARTALYNFLLARSRGGNNILRIEDTDLSRSEKKYESVLIEDLNWLGVEFDEGPMHPAPHAPYRQSERLSIYKKYLDKLIAEKKAYYSFMTAEEAEQDATSAQAAGGLPTYDSHLSDAEVKQKLEQKIPHCIRFKVPARGYSFFDLVRGAVEFPANMLSDFIIARSDGTPVYNFCCVVDDALMEIALVLRASDHINNTLKQLMLYEAFDFKVPEFAHVSLLLGEDRQKLSKRHGALGLAEYKKQGYLPQALANYLMLLGWSHPEEKTVFDAFELQKNFDLTRFSKSPAIFDSKKLKWMNGQYLKQIGIDHLQKALEEFDPEFANLKDTSYRRQVVQLLADKIDILSEAKSYIDSLIQVGDGLNWDENMQMIASSAEMKELLSLIQDLLAKSQSSEYLTQETLHAWFEDLKKIHKVKGKYVFQGIRLSLTHHCSGADLKGMLSLTSVKILNQRFELFKQELKKREIHG